MFSVDRNSELYINEQQRPWSDCEDAHSLTRTFKDPDQTGCAV